MPVVSILIVTAALTLQLNEAMDKTNWPRNESLIGFWPMDDIDNLMEISQDLATNVRYPTQVNGGGPYGNGSYSVNQKDGCLVHFEDVPMRGISWTFAFYYYSEGYLPGRSPLVPPGILCIGKSDFCLEYTPPYQLGIWRRLGNNNYDSWQLSLLEPGVWNFISFTFDFPSKTLNVYGNNGSTLAASISQFDIDFDVETIKVGHNHDGQSMNYPDQMTCMIMYNTALTTDEIVLLPHLCQFRGEIPPVAPTTTPDPTDPFAASQQATTTVKSAYSVCAAYELTNYQVNDPEPYHFNNALVLVPPFPEETSPPFETSTNVQTKCNHFNASLSTPPVYDHNPIRIHVALLVRKLLEIDNVNEVISLNAYTYLSWNISTCPVNSTDGELLDGQSRQQIYVGDPSTIWTPRLRFINSEKSKIYMQNLEKGDDLISGLTRTNPIRDSVNRTITFYWTREGRYAANCRLNLRKYPFDSQTCNITLALTRSDQSLKFINPMLIWSNQFQHSEWSITNLQQFQRRQYFKGYFVSVVDFQITLTRVPDYYLLNLVLPIATLGILDIATLMFPPTMMDRAAFVATNVLALIVAHGDVLKNVPKKSENILLNDYVQQITYLSCVICFYELFLLLFQPHIEDKRKSKTMEIAEASVIVIGLRRKWKITKARIVDIIAVIIFTLLFLIIHYRFASEGDWKIFTSRIQSIFSMWTWI